MTSTSSGTTDEPSPTTGEIPCFLLGSLERSEAIAFCEENPWWVPDCDPEPSVENCLVAIDIVGDCPATTCDYQLCMMGTQTSVCQTTPPECDALVECLVP